MQAQIEALSTRLNQLSKAQVNAITASDLPPQAQEGLASSPSQAKVEQVDFVGTESQPNNPYSNTYNPGWRDHPNFGWKNNNNAPPGFGQQSSQQRSQNNGYPSLEEKLSKVEALATARMDEKFSATDKRLQSKESVITNLEVQMGVMVKSLAE